MSFSLVTHFIIQSYWGEAFWFQKGVNSMVTEFIMSFLIKDCCFDIIYIIFNMNCFGLECWDLLIFRLIKNWNWHIFFNLNRLCNLLCIWCGFIWFWILLLADLSGGVADLFTQNVNTLGTFNLLFLALDLWRNLS